MPLHRAAAATDDLSTLAWVIEELRKSLDAAHKALRRYLRETETVSGSDLDDVDPAVLRTARQQIHQSMGALELIDIPEGAQLLRAAEAVVQRYVAKPQRLDAAGVASIEQASHALLDYLGRRLAGKPVDPVGLFPALRPLLELSGAERVHPADLWPHDWSWRDIAPLPVTPRAPEVLLAHFEKRLLGLVRGHAPDQAVALRADCCALAAHLQTRPGAGPELVTLWRLAAAFFEAWALDLLPDDVFVKRTASRVLAQLRQLVKGDTTASDRLAQDLWFYGARSVMPAGAATPCLHVAQAAYGVPTATTAPVDYNQTVYGRRDPALVAQARRRVESAKQAYGTVAGGELHELAHLPENFAVLQEALARVFPSEERLGAVLHDIARQVAAARQAPEAALSMEVATALLCLEAALEDGEIEEPSRQEHLHLLADRLVAAAAGAPPQPLEPWMEAVYRRMSDRQTLGSVVHELRTRLQEVERQLDRYFRDPDQPDVLQPVPGELSDMRGVLTVLGMDAAERAVARMREDVLELGRPGAVDPFGPEAVSGMQRLAGNLGALGFLIDMLHVQPQLARVLFVFDTKTGVLAPLAGRHADVPDLVDRAQAIAEAARREGSSLTVVTHDLDALAAQPLLEAQPELGEAVRAARVALAEAEAGGSPADQEAAREHLLAAMTDFVSAVTAPAPLDALEPSFSRPAPLDEGIELRDADLAEDPELRQVFLDEALEVLTQAHESLGLLVHAPADLPALTAMRRVFHTLKGSARMVGLVQFGEAAWSCEQLYNHWLAGGQPASPELLRLSDEVVNYFAAWSAAIAAGPVQGFQAAPVSAAADALRAGLAAPPVGLPGAEAGPAAAPDAVAGGLDLEIPEAAPAPVLETLQPSQPVPLDAVADRARLDLSLDEPAPAEPTAAPASELARHLPPDLTLDLVAPPAEEALRTVGPLSVPADLFAVYTAEADEGSRRLVAELEEWALEPQRPVAESTIALAHTLGGSSATVGYQDLCRLARSLEAALERARPAGTGEQPPCGPEDHALFLDAAQEIRRLLQQFAAGFLREPDLELQARLTTWAPASAWPDAADEAGEATLSVPLPGRPEVRDEPPAELPAPAGVEPDPGATDPAAGARPAPALARWGAALASAAAALVGLGGRRPESTAPDDAALPSAAGALPPAPGAAGEAPVALVDTALPVDAPADAPSVEGFTVADIEDLPAADVGLGEPPEASDAARPPEPAFEATGTATVPAVFSRDLEVDLDLDQVEAALPPPAVETLGFEVNVPAGSPAEATPPVPPASTPTPDDDTSVLAEPAPAEPGVSVAEAVEDMSASPDEERPPVDLDLEPVEPEAPAVALVAPTLTAALPVLDEVIELDLEPEPAPEPATDTPPPAVPPADEPVSQPVRPEPVRPEPVVLRDVVVLEALQTDIDERDQVDAELFPVFDEEAEELLPQLTRQVAAWQADPRNQDAAGACMRLLHTFKGGARLAGAMRLGEMAHRCESAIQVLMLREHVDPDDLSALQGRIDALGQAFDRLRRQQAGEVLSGFAPFGSTVTDWSASRTGPGPLTDFAPDGEQEMTAPAEPPVPVDWARLAETPRPTSVAENVQALVRPLERAAPVSQPVRVRIQVLDRLVNLAGEVNITRARLDTEVGQIRGSLADLADNLDRLNQQLGDIALQADTQLQSRREAARHAAQDFDPLELDRYTRLQELTRILAESVNDVATVRTTLQRTLQTAEDDLAAQARLTRELQSDLLRTRMVEFDSLSERLYRVVRQAAKETGKLVRLDLVGGGIEVDRSVLDRMVPAFEHLLRNCVSHGIELPAQRQSAGKDPTGSVVITVEQEGNEVTVEIRDDGAGLDLAAIRARAEGMGLVPPGAALSDRELAQLILVPGLSTASAVTELSGRGVGMDVVRADVQAMGGRVEIRSEGGRGSRFKLVLPLTTVVTQVVMLRSGKLSIAVPSNLIELVQRATPQSVETAYAEGVYLYGGLRLPFYWLGALLERDALGPMVGRTQPVVILRSAQHRVALHVDDVQGTHEVVVKNLGPQLSGLPGLAGMTTLPDGQVALIYNPVTLAAIYGDTARERARQALHQPDAAADGSAADAPQAPLILVVDDSLTVRRVTRRLLEREGYRVLLAKDGLEALDLLADERPAVVLSDIEMPRMDGFDLLRNIRGDALLADLPVLMITSRIAEKHRDHALQLGADHYLGKPYSEDELLSLIRRYIPRRTPARVA